MTRYGKGTAINLTRITSPDQINVINDNFRKIQTQLMGVKNYLEPIAQAGKEASDRLNQYLGSDPPVSHPQMVNYAQKQIAMGPTPPDEPDVGDVWFVTDDSGNVIAIRHWDGTQWVDDVNNQAIQDAISQAQQETEEAKQQAQDAVDRANQAVQSANDAIQQAQQGFDAAQSALTTATNAQTTATDAATKAQQSFDAAQEALTNATNAQSKADDAVTQAQTAFDNAQNALTTAQNALDASNVLSQRVDQNSGDISTLYQTTDSLGSRITNAEGNISSLQQTADSFATRLSDAEGNITTLTQTAQGLQTSVSDLQGTVSTLTQTASSLESRLSDAEGGISSLQQTASNLISRISDAEGNISTLQQTSDSLANRISDAEGDISSLTQTALGLQTSVSDLQGDVSTLTQTANSLNSTITNVQNALNNLQVGARNLVRNSSGDYGTSGWMTINNGDSLVVDDGYGGHKAITRNITAIGGGIYTPFADVVAGVTYTLSFWVKTDKDATVGHLIKFRNSNGVESNPIPMTTVNISANTWNRIMYTVTIPDGIVKIATTPRVQAGSFPIKLWVSQYKLELGNKATDWTPAPEDYDTQFSSINQTIDSITTIVQDAQGDISALQQTADSLATRITNAEGNISTLTQTVSGLQTTVTDVQGDVSSLTQTASALQSRMTNAEGDISLLTQTTDSLTSQIRGKADQSWVSSQISQLSDDINLRVSKDDIINQINLSTEGILIDGKKIHITGQTTIDNAVIKDAMIESVSASKISATSLSAISANLGNVTAGTINGVNINGVSIYGSTIEGSEIKSSDTPSYYDPNFTNRAILHDGTLTIESKGFDGSGAIVISDGNVFMTGKPGSVPTVPSAYIPPDNSFTSYMNGSITSDYYFYISAVEKFGVGNLFNVDFEVKIRDKINFNLPTNFYEPIIAEKFVYTDAIENNLNGSGVNIYIRPKNELRVTSPGSTTSYLPLRASNVYSNSVDINDLTSGVNLYLRPQSGGEVRVTVTGTTTTYAPMRAKEYNPPNSLREMKKNIEEFTDDVLDTFRNIKTYTFNYNFEEDGAKKTLGLMLDEAPEIIWNASGDSINMYSSIGYLFTGLKQTVAKLDEYKATIEDLEKRLSVVENKMA